MSERLGYELSEISFGVFTTIMGCMCLQTSDRGMVFSSDSHFNS